MRIHLNRELLAASITVGERPFMGAYKAPKRAFAGCSYPCKFQQVDGSTSARAM